MFCIRSANIHALSKQFLFYGAVSGHRQWYQRQTIDREEFWLVPGLFNLAQAGYR